MALPLVFFGGSLSLVASLWRALHRHPDVALFVGAALAFVLITTVFLVRRQSKLRNKRKITSRPAGEPVAANPNDRRARRRPAARHAASRALAPPVSGQVLALVVSFALLLPAALVPSALLLPPWLAVEAVLALWWLVWAATFAGLLYFGRPIAEDGPSGDERAKGDGVSADFLEFDDISVDGEGAGAIIGVLLALILLCLLSWVIAEFIIPMLFFLGYTLVTRALRHVVNDTHDCQGSAARSLGWGVIWATAYTAPLALVTVAVHLYLVGTGGALPALF